MKIEQAILIEDLIERTKLIMNQVEGFGNLELEQLNCRMSPESWCILECIEHLNLYGDFYLPEIENRLSQNNGVAVKMFKSGLLGNYFAKSMLPREKLNKMQTFKDKNPVGSQLDKSTIKRFTGQQKKLLDLLDKSRSANLNKVKTSISISKWVKLKLGDTFRIVVYHNERHFVQASTNLSLQNNTGSGSAILGNTL